MAMEGRIATWYAKNTGRDLRRFEETARTVTMQAPAGSHILEVAPGPGYLAIELAKRGYTMTAVDISHSFVRIARENAGKAGVTVDVQHGNASALPFADGSFDFIVCTAAFKNFSDPVGALNEMHRVLCPGGRACIYDLRKDASDEEIDAEVETMQMSRLNAIFTRLVFKYSLLKRAYTRADLQHMARESSFGRGDIVTSGIGFELRLTKRA
jgi:ubiquinone/menaquinone biosynthesis C-methylase UbiE